MYPILSFAFLSLSIAAFKFLELSKYKLLSPSIVYDVLERLQKSDSAGAERVVKNYSGTESRILLKGIKNHHLPKSF